MTDDCERAIKAVRQKRAHPTEGTNRSTNSASQLASHSTLNACLHSQRAGSTKNILQQQQQQQQRQQPEQVTIRLLLQTLRLMGWFSRTISISGNPPMHAMHITDRQQTTNHT